MKKILGLFIMIAGMAVSAFAQEQQGDRPMQPRTPEERATRQTEMMTRMLSLSEEQKTRVYDVNLKSAKQNEKFREAKDTANIRVIQVARENAYKKILSDEQFKQYEEMKARRKEHRGERMRREPGGE